MAGIDTVEVFELAPFLALDEDVEVPQDVKNICQAMADHSEPQLAPPFLGLRTELSASLFVAECRINLS